jgi:3-hydroxy-D-aspartate aldolase
MTQPPPARVGDPLAAVDTPALLVELPAFEANLARMARLARAAGLRLRPHAKTHKSPVVALRQIALGAVGQCCQKVAEAEILAAGGVADILISNQVVGASKLERVGALARRVALSICADDAGNVAELGAAARRYGATLTVLVEIDAGMGRCGVTPGEAAADLAGVIAATPGLAFGGLQAYHGSAQHLRGHGERRAAVAGAGERVKRTLEALARRGLPCPQVTGAGTGTFEFEAESGLWTELQCGSYAFMDADYGRNLDAGGEPIEGFAHSLFLWTTVMSRPAPDRAVCDVGLKSTSTESGLQLVADLADVTYRGASDEHGTLIVGPRAAALPLGSRLRLIPGHCDPTINLHDWYVALRDGRVEALWPIAARGAST